MMTNVFLGESPSLSRYEFELDVDERKVECKCQAHLDI